MPIWVVESFWPKDGLWHPVARSNSVYEKIAQKLKDRLASKYLDDEFRLAQYELKQHQEGGK